LKKAIDQYGTEFTSRVTGLSVGSEDLYRISPIGIAAESGYGAEPYELVKYINKVRQAFADTPLASVPIGHVDTWNDWVNGTNADVVNAVDWIGIDAYPYFQSTFANSINNAENLFDDAYNAVVGVAGGKDVWITETGWPVSGPTFNEAVASTENAKKFWDDVACKYVGKVNVYWYTLQDAYPVTPSPSFGIVGTELSTTPLFDLTCPKEGSSSSSTASTTAHQVSTSAAEPIPTGSAPVSSGGALVPSGGAGQNTVISSRPASSDSASASGTASTIETLTAPSTLASQTSAPVIIGTGTGSGALPTGGAGSGNGNGTFGTPTQAAPSSTFTGAAAATAAPMMVLGAAVAVALVL
jgi:glucan endo-1,3-beta-D-glucosidase